jgi:hypothetical protein
MAKDVSRSKEGLGLVLVLNFVIKLSIYSLQLNIALWLTNS